MRVTYFADIRFPLERANGIQTIETCHALARRGHGVALIVRPDTHQPPRDPLGFYGLPPEPRLRVERVPVPSSGPAAAKRLGYLAFAAGRAAGQGRAGALFTRDLGVAAALLRIPRAMRPPLVYESHGYAPDVAAALPALVATATAPSPAKLRRLAAREARVWREAEGYVTITRGLAEALRGRFGDRPHLSVVPDGVRLRPPAAGRVAGNLVAYAGHLYAWKGVDVLLQALALVPEARGLIVGGHAAEPDLERTRRLAESLGLAGRVTFTGLVAPDRVPALLASARVLVLPNTESVISTTFTSPLKLFEYMAAERPIVASDLPSLREVLRDGEHALLVPPGDAGALAAAIRRLLGDPSFADRLAAAARRAVEGYTWDHRAAALEGLLTEVAGVTDGAR